MAESVDRKFCCAIKKYYSKDENLVGTLDISPRLIICKKPLCVNQDYEQMISVKNTGMYPRSIKFSTDSPKDTKLKIIKLKRFEYLDPASTFYISVLIRPLSKENINVRRNVFLETEHPNVKIEIPIIVIDKKTDVYLPTSIDFPHTVLGSYSYYDFTVFNASKFMGCITVRGKTPNLTINVESCKIKSNDFVRVLLKLNAEGKKITKGSITIRFGNVNYVVYYRHQPKCTSLYLSTQYVQFDETKFEREGKRQFTICNETDISIPYTFIFKTITIKEESSAIFRETELNSELSQESFTSEIQELKEEEEEEKEDIQPLKDLIKNFTISPQEGELLPNTCTKIDINFHPRYANVDYDDTLAPPYKNNVELSLTSTNENVCDDLTVLIDASIGGPEMFITPKSIDFRKVYLGEEHCEQVRITNIDGIVKSEIKFFDFNGSDMAQAFVSPEEGLELEPCETGVFNITFFTIKIGKIYFKLRFKVKNGEYFSIVVKATSVPVRVKTFPDIIEFGTVPFAVPQKRTVLLMNPLSVPISMQFFIEDNGSEIPLVLNVDDVKELPPITIRNPIENIMAAHMEEKISAYHASSDENSDSKASTSRMYQSVSDDETSIACSGDFQNEVIESIPQLALEVVNAIKLKRVSEKNEPEAKIISQVTDELLNLEYFFDLKKYNNYARMDWNVVPSDPIEVYFDTEVIHLRPNASRSFTVLIIPNCVGYFNRAISIRCCPHMNSECDGFQKNPYEMIVESQLMVTKIWFEYHCRIPDIAWESDIVLKDKLIYAMQTYDVDIELTNESTVGGFLHFVVVPYCVNGVLRFRDNVWKFYIPAGESLVAKCEVEFRVIGDVTLTGMVKVVGSCIGIPFHIKAHVLPPKISIHPKEIIKRQNVLETTVVYIYIHNLTPTKTRLKLYLRNEHHQSIDPHGAQLAPTGQGMYVALTTMFPDPEVYKNVLYVDLLFGHIREVPLTFNIVGMPLFFVPDITKGLDLGVILLSSVTDYESRKTNSLRIIRVCNDGDRPYTITFNKLKVTKSGNHQCKADNIRAQIYLSPKSIYLNPGEENFISITAVSCQEVLLQSEFRYVTIDQSNPKRVLSKTFTITARFAQAELSWSRREVRIKFNRTHVFKQKQQLEMVQLINDSGAFIEKVFLRACGPFKIKAAYEHPFSKELRLKMSPNEQKEITILVEKKKLKNTTLSFMKGRIFCDANKKAQKWLSLRLDINYPDVIVVESDIIIFSTSKESQTDVALENVGLLDAEYKWKKLGECMRYIAQNDDYERYARDILADIIRMLELHEEDERDNDSLCARNATLCYQKYRCKLAALEDPDGIVDIIHDIINNLDLENRRYKIHLSDDTIDQMASEAFEASSKTYVKETFERILEKLKLEDSYEISDPSEDECAKNEHFYFYEKSGIVLAKQGAFSLVHLPAVAKGYAHMGCFLLDVVGGQPQTFTVTVVNLDKIVEICPKSIYLGVRPWYELFNANIRVYNTTPFKVYIHVNDVPRPKKANRRHYYLSDGYACVLGSRVFHINPFCAHRIKTEGIIGFTSEFIREFKLLINDYSWSSFRLRGQGVMPILLATQKNLPRTDQDQCDIVEEYRLLQRIYYFNLFKDITDVDEDLEVPPPEDIAPSRQISFSQISMLSTSEYSGADRAALCERIVHNWELLLGSYVIVYNNASLPDATLLEQLLNMEKFKDQLNDSSEKRNILQRLYRDYMKWQCKYDPRVPINLKYFTVQPLPFEQWGYIIDMPNLKLNQFRKYEIDLQFFGPGKLIAAARTAVKMPGLYVHFQVKSHSGQEFIFYRTEEKMPDFFIKQYQNMWEREIELEVNPKILRAHSFDCEYHCQYHKRDISKITTKDRRDIKNYYNSLNKSVYQENKHHFINSMIYSTSPDNFSGTILRINIVIKIDSKYYTRGQIIEDYLYIDLHMGPTLPILLRGLIK